MPHTRPLILSAALISLLTAVLPALAAPTVSYEYDAEGHLTKVTDGLQHATSHLYDTLNRRIQTIDPLSGVTLTAYDLQDHITGVTDPRGLVTGYQVNAFGEVTELNSPDTGTAFYQYDTAGRLTSRTDAKGNVLTRTYDALGRVLTETHTPAGGGTPLVITYTYDQGQNGIGRLTGLSDPSGSIAYVYDARGRVLAETRTLNGTPYVTGYTYDTSGRLLQTTYPSGRTIDYTYNAAGQVSQLTSTRDGVTQTLANNIAYYPFGGLQSLTFGNGAPYTRQYDQNGRLSAYTLGSDTYTLGYDDANRITFTSAALNPIDTKNYGYDALDRLTQYTGPSENQGYSYDANGNRTALTLGGNTYNYTNATISNHLTATQGPAPQKSYTYDANGSPTADNVNQYSYDARGRLIQAVTPAGTAEYGINALGQRISKTVGTAGTVFHYDLQGHLIAESDGTGKVTQETVYLGDTPVAVFK